MAEADEQRLGRIEAAIGRLEAALERVEARLDETQRSCSNMDGHINFVEGVYTAVRQPLSYLAARLSGMGQLPTGRLTMRSFAPHSVAASASPPATDTLDMRP